MKKIVLVGLLCIAITGTVQARDYAKLQIKELRHAQKYGSTKILNTNANIKQICIQVKDPKILKFGDYEPIEPTKYSTKITADSKIYEKYKKYFSARKTDNFNVQAYGNDYYKIYRIAERIIRANRLDYINWRIGIESERFQPNAYSANTNYIGLNTAMIDSFIDNDDALAMVIGHEMGHALLGHQKRKEKTRNALVRAENRGKYLRYQVLRRKYLIDSKNMEYAADNEGAILAAKAGYNLDNGKELLNFLNTIGDDIERESTHPNSDNRIKNFNENKKYYMEQEWKELGKYNIYNTNVLDVKMSSDRHSMIISRGKNSNNSNSYRLETLPQLYTRYAYGSYKNGEFKQALNYFEKLFEIENTNASAYLYASYSSEALYQKSGKESYLQLAKNYINYAKNLDPNNKYILEQVKSLDKSNL